MPELPEVEVVRRGLERWAVGRTVSAVEVLHPRAIRRHAAGAADFTRRLTGRRLLAACRRGKYLWLPLDSGDALVGHLGMSGQLLIRPHGIPDERHLRVRMCFDDDGPQLRYVDQRTFGGLSVEPVEPVEPVEAGDGELPPVLAHIARDPLDPRFDEAAFVAAVRRRDSGIKRALLDQTLVSGVGNIYADEGLWRAKLHWARSTRTLTRPALLRLLGGVRDVMTEAIGVGGTSFDHLYVDVNGDSGYFERALAVYGRRDEPCLRCGAPIRRDAFMNRSSYTCPRCQPRPRNPHY